MGVKDVYSYRKAPLVEEMLKCPEHLESLPEQATAEAPKRRGRPPKEQAEPKSPKAEKTAKPRAGRPPKGDKAARAEAQAAAAHDLAPKKSRFDIVKH